jgi:quercetin dioxygenase-like cupin family protein
MFLLLAALAAAGPVTDGDTAPSYRIAAGKGTATLLLGPANGTPEAALDVLTFEDGAAVPPHVHDASAELLYVLEGRVEMVIGGQVVVAEKGDAIRIPAGVEHSARAVGTLRAVQVYVGPGPEQRFTAGEKVR